MIAVDTNILVHAHRADAPFHASARGCVTTLAEGRAAWALPWPCIHEFLGLVTRPRVFQPPTSLDGALEQVEIWMTSPSLVLLGEGGSYWSELAATLRSSRVVGSQVHDARIAALCLSHGVRELWTADRDFSRFAGLALRNPLVINTPRGYVRAPRPSPATRSRSRGATP